MDINRGNLPFRSEGTLHQKLFDPQTLKLFDFDLDLELGEEDELAFHPLTSERMM